MTRLITSSLITFALTACGPAALVEPSFELPVTGVALAQDAQGWNVQLPLDVDLPTGTKDWKTVCRVKALDGNSFIGFDHPSEALHPTLLSCPLEGSKGRKLPTEPFSFEVEVTVISWFGEFSTSSRTEKAGYTARR